MLQYSHVLFGLLQADENFNVNSICLAVAVFSWPVWCLPCTWKFQSTFHICTCCNILITCLVLPMQVCVQASSTPSPRRFCSIPSTTPVGSHQRRSITLDRATDSSCHRPPRKPDSDCCLDVYGQHRKNNFSNCVGTAGFFFVLFSRQHGILVNAENSNSGGLTDTHW